METLKTLKEIRPKDTELDDIREEAIKHYKDIKESNDKTINAGEGSINDYYDRLSFNQGQMAFIIKFFNLTEEDLK